ncbi:MAG: adenylate/guanylate cyclase domain-containing protein [Alphaproteobacteria bacterium]|nr:adenylate/guanylate cyclase domain-containing protein [Alphaproteobacteria bacterium]
MIERFLTNRWLQTALLLALLCASVAFSFSHARWREQIRNFTFDNYNILKPRQSSDSIVIVDIDEASLKERGQMPWPRSVMAELVRTLDGMGAKLIVFDMVFPEPDRSSPATIADEFADMPGFAAVNDMLRGLPDHDAVFGEEIKDAGNVITGFSFTNEETGAVPAQKGIFRGKGVEKFVPTLNGVTANLKSIGQHAAGNGSFFVSTDTDGIIRRVPMLVAYRKPGSSITGVYPSLALESIRVLEGERGGSVILGDPAYARLDPARFGIAGIEIGQAHHFIPTNARGEFPVYFARSNPDWYISAHKILDGAIPPERIRDRIVLVGTSAVGLKDIRSTPLDTFIPGVEVHLNIIDQILQGQFLRRSIEAEGLEAVSIFIAGMFIIILSPFIGAGFQILALAIALTAALYGGWYAFATQGMLIDITYPILSLLATFMLSTVLTYWRTEKERRQVRTAFGLYISPTFMKELTEDPEKLRLGGEIRDLTIMFTDIRNFTTISEGMSPEALIQLINDFLTPMSDLVMENRGTIDKYNGDAMMAFWNAPLDDVEHARHACLAALGMQNALTPINENLEKKALEAGKTPIPLRAGIGINTGPCAVGNMGSRQRFAYSALGDAVNVASRLEGQTKFYGVSILIGESTKDHVPDLATLEVDLVRVKGRAQPVRLFALLGDSAMAQMDSFIRWKTAHERMIVSYRSRDFDGTLTQIDELAGLVPDSMRQIYDLYQARAWEFKSAPPPPEWDGIYDALTK